MSNKLNPTSDSREDKGSGETLPKIINNLHSKDLILNPTIPEDHSLSEDYALSPRKSSPDLRDDHHYHHGSNSDSKHLRLFDNFSISPFVVIFIVVQVLVIILIVLESYALYQDQNWNTIVQGNSSFPDLLDKSRVFFTNKTLNIKEDKDEKLQTLLKRDSPISPIFIAFTGIALITTFVHVLLIYVFKICIWSDVITSFLYLTLGIVHLISGSLMAVMLVEEYEGQYRKAADILFLSNRSEGAGKAEKLRELRIEEEIFASVLTLCAFVSKIRTGMLWTTPTKLEDADRPIVRIHTDYSIQLYSIRGNKTEVYFLSDLDYMGFCDLSYMRTSEYLLGFLAAVLSWTIPLLNYFRGKCCNECLRERETRPDDANRNKTVLTLLAKGDENRWNEGEISPPGRMSDEYPPDESDSRGGVPTVKAQTRDFTRGPVFSESDTNVKDT